jgi:hypothetical protein
MTRIAILPHVFDMPGHDRQCEQQKSSEGGVYIKVLAYTHHPSQQLHVFYTTVTDKTNLSPTIRQVINCKT